jgi:hypothetical protein
MYSVRVNVAKIYSVRFLASEHDSVEILTKKSKVVEILGWVENPSQKFKNRYFSKIASTYCSAK